MYQVLARKYRPRNFNELVGQNHVSRALTSALERGPCLFIYRNAWGRKNHHCPYFGEVLEL
jgi:hypothetical protein